MFIDLGLLSRFNIDYLTMCRFLLTVKRNYRNETVKYHNW
jgi:dual 3',5'-cyclic-AMP and -GMP phosphodiesterase 11